MKDETSRHPAAVLAVLAVLTALLTAAMLAARVSSYGSLVLPLTVAASTGFLLMALAGRCWSTWYGRFIALGLAGCWVGDVVGPANFMAGVAAFLAAHLGFIIAFLCHGPRRNNLVRGLLVLLPSALLAAWLLPHVSAGDQPLVVAYLVVISVMVALAAGASGSPGGRWALAAAIIFYVSDIFVARWRYVAPGPLNMFLCYPLYYTACVLFAASIFASNPPPSPANRGSGP